MSRIKIFLIIICVLQDVYYTGADNNNKDTLIVSGIKIQGNGITKENIILREIVFKKGDSLEQAELEELIERSKENILNTSLFNFVTITYEIGTNNELTIYVNVQERWYIWPYPILEHADRNLSSFIKNREWSRVDYGLYFLINNFRGRKEILKLKTIFGYNNSFVIHYSKPFIDKKQQIGIGFEGFFSRNHELPFQVVNDELLYIKLNNEYAIETYRFSSFLIYRPYLYTRNFFDIKYQETSLADSAYALNNNILFNKQWKVNFLSINYVFDHDKRDSKIYPLSGYRFAAFINKTGLGLFTNEGFFYIRSIVEGTGSLAKRVYINACLEGKMGFGNKNSLYFNEAIGYDNYIRGMEYYVANGASYYLSKSNLKYELVSQKALDINFIPSDKFSKAHYALYINMFFDTGYVYSNSISNNNMINEFIYGGGIGIDLVTYYDKVLRIEYSLNKFGEHGIFFHLGAPIIED